MDPLRFNIGRTAYELDPATIARIEPWNQSTTRRHGHCHGYRITFAGSGCLNINDYEASTAIGTWLGRTKFPLTGPPAAVEPEPDPADSVG